MPQPMPQQQNGRSLGACSAPTTAWHQQPHPDPTPPCHQQPHPAPTPAPATPTHQLVARRGDAAAVAQLDIPGHVGQLIGHEGQTVNRLQSQSGARIEVSDLS